MKNFIEKILASKTWLPVVLLVLFAVNFLASVFHSRFDLTKEKRYTLSRPTKSLLKNLPGNVEIDVFVEGKGLPAEVRRLKNTISEFLNDCKDYGRGKLTYRFINPYAGLSDSAQQNLEDSLYSVYGLYPSVIDAPEKAGDKLEISKVIHGAVVKYNGKTTGINLLQGVKGYGTEKEERAALYNDLEATLEYKFASGIQKVTAKEKPIVAYALGNGEAFGYNINDAFKTLRTEYNADTINLKKVPYIPSEINALVILKPTKAFTDEDKTKIEQYVLNGGKIFWMIDNMYAEFDSLINNPKGFTAFDRALNLEDILFRYGVRINQNLLQDMQCDKLPQMSSNTENTQRRLVDWPFFPVLNGTNHPISKNLDGVRTLFPNTIDTVKAEGIKKTILLQSSANARIKTAPAIVNFEFMEIAPDVKSFTVKNASVAVLLEGKFSSLYANRVSQAVIDSFKAYGVPFIKKSEIETKMVVVADGDIATNQFSSQSGPLPMGNNVYTKYTFANKDFFTNTLEYLVNPSGILETRAKDFTLRLLDPVKVEEEKATWQFINIALPVLLVILAGFVYQQIRKRKYAA
jgi:ABC-2 type transport system permease protein